MDLISARKAAVVTALAVHPNDYLTPECSVGRTKPAFRHGCPSCPAPGYLDPVLGWCPRPCACEHHTARAAS